MEYLKKTYNFLFRYKHYLISSLILVFIFKFVLDTDFSYNEIFKKGILYILLFGILFEVSLIFPIIKNFFIFKYSDLKIPKFSVTKLVYFSYLGDNIAMNIGGDITKFSFYRNFFSIRKSIFFILLDKFVNLLIKIIILLIFIYFFFIAIKFKYITEFLLIVFSSILFISLVFIFLYKFLTKYNFKNKLSKLKYFKTLNEIIKKDINLKKFFLIFLFATLFHQLYLCLIFFLICIHLGVDISFVASSIIFLLLIFVSRLPLSFSGFGVREFFSILFFSTLNISASLAFTASIHYGLIGLFPMISASVLYFKYKRIHEFN